MKAAAAAAAISRLVENKRKNRGRRSKIQLLLGIFDCCNKPSTLYIPREKGNAPNKSHRQNVRAEISSICACVYACLFIAIVSSNEEQAQVPLFLCAFVSALGCSSLSLSISSFPLFLFSASA